MNAALIPFRYGAWATRTLLEVSGQLSREQFHRNFPMGCGSIHRTVLHTISAEICWTDRLRGAEPLSLPEHTGREYSVQELISIHDAASADLQSVTLEMIEGGRAGERIEMRWSSQRRLITVATVLTHVVTHGTHHRAQVLNMLRHLGVSPLPEIDPIDWELSNAAS